MKIFRHERIEKLIVILIFSVAMGFLEGVIVYYLQLLPPISESLNLPAVPNFPKDILLVEQLREVATMVMLTTLALLAEKKNWQRFLVFIFAFSVWDLVYYASLYWLASWPTSLFELDIVFLLPIQWTFPVYFPVILFFILAILSAYKLLKND